MANPEGFLESRKQEILKCFNDDNVKTVVLFGQAGVGKTWMAKKISNSASLEGSSYGTIWVVPGYNSEGKSLVEYIAIQLSVIPSNEEWEEYDNAEMEHQKREVNPENLKEEIWTKLESMKSAILEGMKTAKPEEKSGKLEPKATVKVDQKDSPRVGKDPYLLVVLDDIDDEKKVLADLNALLSHYEKLIKVLITRRGSDTHIGSEGNGDAIRMDNCRSYEIEFLSPEDSSNLLRNRVKGKVPRATGFERLCGAIVKGSSGHPGTIIIIAEALNHVEDFELENAVEELASIMESADIKTVLQHVYKMLPSTLNKCCWHCGYLFLNDNSSVHYSELITHWLLEGYFDHHDHIGTAYEEAHHTLMELKGRGFLREKENSYVTMDSDAFGVNDHRRDGLSGSAYVGLASVLNDQTRAGLGSVIQTNGMIKTSSKEWDEMSTLFTDGAHFCREFPETFYQHIQRLKVLVILNPMFKKLPTSLSVLKELQVFILRGCGILESIDVICELTNLLVLEISGARMVKEIRDDLFEHMKDLRSLNLSEVGIKWLPASLLNRSELRWLIFRKCLDLEQLCEDNILKEKEAAKQEVLSLAKLEVLDLSGSFSFHNIQVKTLSPLKKLQILNLSKTKVKRLPSLHGLGELTKLLLSDCPSLARLPPLRPLLKLEILNFSKTTSSKKIQEDPDGKEDDFRLLDLPGSAVIMLPLNTSSLSHRLLSGCAVLPKLPSTQGLQGLEELNLDASILEEFEDQSFEHLKSLRRLILSNTKIKALPSLPQHSELRLLLLKNCKCLTELPNLPSVQKLEVLDLSGCSELVIASNDSFWGMSRLKTINLSETKIKSLPQDCFPVSLRHLRIRNCPHWNNLPYLEHLFNLEVLDLCGAKSLIDIELDFLHHMSKLRILNLSEIEFEQLPSLSHLTNLRNLSLRGCSCKVSKLDALKELELLDLSGTKVESLPPLETFRNLKQLLLGDCANLESLENLKSLTELEVLDLSGTKIKEFPYEISDLTSLMKLNLQNMKHMKEIDWKKIKYIPEEFNLGCCGSLTSEIAESSEWPSISICGTRFLQFVEEKKLWDTYFQKFHFSVWLPKNSDGRIYDLGDRGLLRDIKSCGRIPHDKEPGRYLEIHGSSCFSSMPVHVLQRADHISLINVSCLNCVRVQSEDFGDLKHLYIDCCPMLIYPFSKLPEKLETLQIKFCENMEKLLFDPDMPIECNLQTLDLLQLPKLERIGVRMVSLRVLKVRQCPKLENLEEVLGVAENLQILHMSHAAELKTICSQEVKPETFKNLKQLKIESCPKLKEVSPSSELPQKLEILEINSCESLETIFRGNSEGSSLKRLRLCNLPRLSSTVFKVPPQCQVDSNCLNLQLSLSS